MKSNLTGAIRLAPTKNGQLVQCYIEDVASGEVIFQALLTPVSFESLKAGETVMVSGAVTDYPERLGREVTVVFHVVPSRVVISAKRRQADVLKVITEWFMTQPEFLTVHEFDVDLIDGVWNVVAREWAGLDLENDQEDIVEDKTTTLVEEES